MSQHVLLNQVESADGSLPPSCSADDANCIGGNQSAARDCARLGCSQARIVDRVGGRAAARQRANVVLRAGAIIIGAQHRSRCAEAVPKARAAEPTPPVTNTLRRDA